MIPNTYESLFRYSNAIATALPKASMGKNSACIFSSFFWYQCAISNTLPKKCFHQRLFGNVSTKDSTKNRGCIRNPYETPFYYALFFLSILSTIKYSATLTTSAMHPKIRTLCSIFITMYTQNASASSGISGPNFKSNPAPSRSF